MLVPPTDVEIVRVPAGGDPEQVRIVIESWFTKEPGGVGSGKVQQGCQPLSVVQLHEAVPHNGIQPVDAFQQSTVTVVAEAAPHEQAEAGDACNGAAATTIAESSARVLGRITVRSRFRRARL